MKKIYLFVLIIIMFSCMIFTGCEVNNSQKTEIMTDDIINDSTIAITTDQSTSDITTAITSQISSEITTVSEISQQEIEYTTHEREINSSGDIEIGGYYYHLNTEEILLHTRNEEGEGYDCDSVLTNEDFNKLPQFTDLKTLSGTITSEQLEYLLLVPNVEKLYFSYSDFPNDIDGFFSQFENLNTLWFGMCGPNNLDCVKGCDKLKSLYICAGEEYDLSPLSELTTLEYLGLNINNFSNSYSPIYCLKNLKELVLPLGLSEDIVNEIQKALPDCKISFETQ